MKLRNVSTAKLCVFTVILLTGLPGFSFALNRPECIADSNERSGFMMTSAPCGTYGVVKTREKEGQDVVVQYMVHLPEGVRNGLVVLFAGGNGNTGIVGDPVTGKVIKAGNNFLVRSAQLFSRHHYLAVTIDRPLVRVTGELVPEFPGNPSQFDRHRISPEHGNDIAAVIKKVKTKKDLPVFLAGTSRGALSAVAQHLLDVGIVGILLSSPVTSPGSFESLYIGHPSYPNLQPRFVTVPVHVLAHKLDGCYISTPPDSAMLHAEFMKAGVDSRFDEVTGGFNLAGRGSITPCDARTYHGFLGMENSAVKKITNRMDRILKGLKRD